jgi:hypothetical protein
LLELRPIRARSRVPPKSPAVEQPPELMLQRWQRLPALRSAHD